MKKSIRLGSLFMDGKYFRDEANQTIGKPMLTPEIGINRRLVTNRVTEEGKKVKQKVINYFKEKFDVDVKLSWSKYAGCTMCPCSPGFKIVMLLNTPGLQQTYQWHRSSEKTHINIWANEDGSFNIRPPKNYYNLLDQIPIKDESKREAWILN